jgi:eukaryotic-like serine/threonine-protein kinase|tara:strand:- start:261109 stop:262518 length:1410 start_codon:yes stop_codon:yes gene_type:complete
MSQNQDDNSVPRLLDDSALSGEKPTPVSPDDTANLDPGATDAATVEDSEKSIMAATKSGTNLDTLIGRLVIDQGLATSEEVKHCKTMTRAEGEGSANKSLAHVLVDREFITKRQLARLREAIEAERSGSKISGYKILGKLGAGAMATVYKAKQVSLDRMVALKKLPEKFSQNPQFIERFFAEGRAAASLNHPNIVQAFDVGNEGDIYYFVMEYVEGRTVHEDIVEHKRFNEKLAIEIIIQVAEALEHAHARGLIHRDVKPKNIMITKEGVVKLADMGLARAITDVEAAEAEAGRAFGTPYYISPEQIRGEKDIGPPADIYSLGTTLYHMVTGAVPFEGKSPSAVMHKHLKTELIPPDHVNPKLSAGISEVIEMMMAKKVKNRYKNCTDLLVDLRALKNGEVPPIAHRDVLGEADLTALAAAEAAVTTPMQENTVKKQSSGIADRLLWPPFLILVALLLGSLIGNLLLAM